MPTRLLREGILTSDRVEKLDPQAEVFYRRLMSVVDDYGCFDARPSILRACLYPLRVNRVREADITRWMAACQKAGLIVLYEAEDKSYLQMLDTRWPARSQPKYPLTTVNNCKQVFTPVIKSDNDCLAPNTNTNTNTNTKKGGVGGNKHLLFEKFWELYPKKVGKVAALQAWNEHDCNSLVSQIREALAWQMKSEQWSEQRFIPNPATWINQERWNDYPPEQPPPTKPLYEILEEVRSQAAKQK